MDLLVPVPLHRWRLAGRGFNQAALLARDIARQLGLTVAVQALRRSSNTRTLAGLHPVERSRELRGAFRVRRPEQVAGRRILLIDDVLTTGATAECCCRALKEAGAALGGGRRRGAGAPAASSQQADPQLLLLTVLRDMSILAL